MADVQLEHGHVRIANRLYEALLDADFTATQFKILHGLIRLTYGWSKKSVSISQAELAATIGLRPTGTFRAALRELVVEGVVLCLAQGVGHERATYSIQKDFTQWGRWTIHPERLAKRYGTRPQHRDDLLAKPAADTEPPTPDTAAGCLHSGTPSDTSAQTEAVRVPEQRQADCLNLGGGTGAKSLQDGESETPKAIDSHRQPEEEREQSAGASASGVSGDVLARRLERAQAALGEHWPAVEEFLRSRRSHTWPAWLKELAKLLTGTPYTAEDLAGACSDALALDRPIDGPHAIRAFVAKRHQERRRTEEGEREREERIAQTGAKLSVMGRGSAGLGEAGDLLARLQKLIQKHTPPGQATTRFLRRDDIATLGDDVLKAVDRIGGPSRILDTPAKDWGFLTRELAEALRHARGEAA